MGPRIWSQSVARAALVGGSTHNPGPAAASLLGRARGKRAVRRAVRRVGRLRRSFHRGNPLPAVIGAVLSAKGLVGKLGGRFKTPSEARAGGAAQQLVAAAVAGNLTAAKAIAERTEIGIQKERAVWRKAFTQVPASIVALVKKYEMQIPGVDHSTPEAAAESALARAVDGLALEAMARGEAATRGSAAERRAALAEAKAERREERITGVAGLAAQALLGRGRRRGPTRRRRAPRRLSF